MKTPRTKVHTNAVPYVMCWLSLAIRGGCKAKHEVHHFLYLLYPVFRFL